MQDCKQHKTGRDPEFFRLTLSQDNLVNYYQLNFSLMQFHHYSLTELENMLPWEREIYVGLLINHVNDENEKIKLKQMADKYR
jgi:hypothetical protein